VLTLNRIRDFLKREEAILVLKELFEKCTTLDGHYLELLPPEASTMMSGGYQIVIKTVLDEYTRNCMQDVLMKYHLTIKVQDEQTFTIYKPHQDIALSEHPST
jgi:hypothetical protein